MGLRSMTGYGATSRVWTSAHGPNGPHGPCSVHAEVRSVNARFLEVKIRQPFGAALESDLRKQIESRLGRGRIDVVIAVQAGPGAAGQDATAGLGVASAWARLGVDASRLGDTLRAVGEIEQLAREAKLELQPVNALELLKFVAMQRAPSVAPEGEVQPPFVVALVDAAIDQLVAFREREGQALTEVLQALASTLEQHVAEIAQVASGEAERLLSRFEARLEPLLMQREHLEKPDRDRLLQEAAILVARGDIAEELDRLASHLRQVRSVLDQSPHKGQGKTLDFLSQELLREITTIGSKIAHHTGSGIVIAAKGTIERIREQVQNVE